MATKNKRWMPNAKCQKATIYLLTGFHSENNSPQSSEGWWVGSTAPPPSAGWWIGSSTHTSKCLPPREGWWAGGVNQPPSEDSWVGDWLLHSEWLKAERLLVQLCCTTKGPAGTNVSSALVEVEAQVPQWRLEGGGGRNSGRAATSVRCIESNSFSKRQTRCLNSYKTYRKNTQSHCA